jgi:hypothetical protein
MQVYKTGARCLKLPLRCLSNPALPASHDTDSKLLSATFMTHMLIAANHLRKMQGDVQKLRVYLSRNKVSPDVRDKDMWTAAHWAAFNNHPQIIMELKQKGVCVFVRVSCCVCLVLFVLCVQAAFSHSQWCVTLTIVCVYIYIM